MVDRDGPATGRRTPSVAFFLLMLPFGIAAGYGSVTLAFQLARGGMAAGPIAALMAFQVWPQTWKVLWAPLVDTTLGFRRWHILGTVAVAASVLALSLVPARAGQMALLGGLIVATAVASSVVSMATEGLMAGAVEDDRRGVASGWAMGGNLGGSGIGGGLALWISQHVAARWAPGLALAAICLACVAALPLVRPEAVERARPRLGAGLAEVARALWSLAASRAGVLVMVLMLLPIGSGAAQNLWAATAADWRADADTVALVNGVLGGLASLVGSLIGGRICDRLDRKAAYCLFGLALCAVALAMAVMPRTPGVFVAMTLGYAAVLGACYAAYGAAVLEVVGTSAAATKFQLLAALSNVPIATLIGWDGTFHDWGGAGGMLAGEAAVGVAGVLVFVALVRATRGMRLAWPGRGG